MNIIGLVFWAGIAVIAFLLFGWVGVGITLLVAAIASAIVGSL